jgi:AraC family transcriptional regulator of adaptative response / DNA-3-methyladenine glycosylase II
MIDFDTCDAARLRRDPAFDGVFFIGVKSTGIYCRPVCPARQPLVRNVTFWPSAAAAEAAGFRPCLRCRPETAPFSPAWNGTRTTVERALRLIHEGALDGGTVEALAGRLGVGARHLARLFRQHVGASPVQVAKTARVQRAKRLIDRGELTMSEVARTAGFGSLRRFNTVFLELYGRPPSAVRRGASARQKPPARQVAHV